MEYCDRPAVEQAKILVKYASVMVEQVARTVVGLGGNLPPNIVWERVRTHELFGQQDSELYDFLNQMHEWLVCGTARPVGVTSECETGIRHIPFKEKDRRSLRCLAEYDQRRLKAERSERNCSEENPEWSSVHPASVAKTKKTTRARTKHMYVGAGAKPKLKVPS